MPDWRSYVRENLCLSGASPEKEADTIEDIARQLEDAYLDALKSDCPSRMQSIKRSSTSRIGRGSPRNFSVFQATGVPAIALFRNKGGL